MSSTTSGLGTFTKNRIKIEKNSDEPNETVTKKQSKTKFKSALKYFGSSFKFYNYGSSISLILTKN